MACRVFCVVLNYRPMRWNWKLAVLVAVLSICVVILIAPNVDLQVIALRALQWMVAFFALITGLPAVLFYVPESAQILSPSRASDSVDSAPAPELFSLRC